MDFFGNKNRFGSFVTYGDTNIRNPMSLQCNATAHELQRLSDLQPHKGGNTAQMYRGLFWLNPIIDASYCVPRQQCISDRALFKSSRLISRKTVRCDLTFTGHTVPVKSGRTCACV